LDRTPDKDNIQLPVYVAQAEGVGEELAGGVRGERQRQRQTE
jgi:hypothetical protein